MPKYSAVVSFTVAEIEAELPYKAHLQLHKLIDQLVVPKTDLVWDDVTWELQEESE